MQVHVAAASTGNPYTVRPFVRENACVQVTTVFFIYFLLVKKKANIFQPITKHSKAKYNHAPMKLLWTLLWEALYL